MIADGGKILTEPTPSCSLQDPAIEACQDNSVATASDVSA